MRIFMQVTNSLKLILITYKQLNIFIIMFPSRAFPFGRSILFFNWIKDWLFNENIGLSQPQFFEQGKFDFYYLFRFKISIWELRRVLE